MVLFDIATGKVVTHSEMLIEKLGNAVQYVSGERFVVWNSKGIQVCDVNLQCGTPLGARALQAVSPGGTTAVIASQFERNGAKVTSWGQLKVIDLQSMKESMELSRKPGGKIIPGDGALLIDDLSGAVIRQTGKTDTVVPHFGYETRFLNASMFAHWGSSEAVVRRLDGKEQYRIPVPETWRSAFATTSQGARFGIYEYGYTRLNSVLNFWDIDNARPPDFQRIRILDTANGSKVAEFEWDPRPHLVGAALSPSGHRLARIRSHFVEILPIQ